ncbi:hypothetical protein B0H14DRAFT_3714414, partial [Mycena olivaceomarginata]
PETRTKVIEILAGNVNGCLQELGYAPGLLQKMQYLEDVIGKLRTTNEQLHHDNEKLKAHADVLQRTCNRYQGESVKLYQDNANILADCESLRKELTHLSMQIFMHETTRGKDVSAILREYAAVQNRYTMAVNQLQFIAVQRAQPFSHASGSRSLQPTDEFFLGLLQSWLDLRYESSLVTRVPTGFSSKRLRNPSPRISPSPPNIISYLSEP